jgi:hypothetical protein
MIECAAKPPKQPRGNYMNWDWRLDWDHALELVKTDGKISYWKVMANSTALVVVAVSLPVAGPLGLVSLSTAELIAIAASSITMGKVVADTHKYFDERKKKRAEVLDRRNATERLAGQHHQHDRAALTGASGQLNRNLHSTRSV